MTYFLFWSLVLYGGWYVASASSYFLLPALIFKWRAFSLWIILASLTVSFKSMSFLLLQRRFWTTFGRVFQRWFGPPRVRTAWWSFLNVVDHIYNADLVFHRRRNTDILLRGRVHFVFCNCPHRFHEHFWGQIAVWNPFRGKICINSLFCISGQCISWSFHYVAVPT